ncbi:MAG: hypothetical protein DBX47_00450 [Clostridiales bacterium]|nr:MAG: hypothetical protein DBX47_00450 [Clostridiales bacterium]
MKLTAAKISEKAKIPAKMVAKYALDAGIGFLLANISTAQSFAPFGIAYASNTTLFGLLGTISGYAMMGHDFWRYLIAVVVAYVARIVMQNVIDVSPQIGAFFYTVWGSIVGGAGGIFIYSYTFRENLLFMLSGAISGLFAYVFTVARLSTYKKISVPEKINYICFFVTMSVLIVGIMALGEIFTSVGVVLSIFMLLCVSGSCGFLYASGGAMFVSFALCLYNTSYLWLSGVIILGTVFASVLKELGKNSQVIGFLLSNVLVGIYYGGSYNMWSMLANIVIAGILYTFLPKKTLNRITSLYLPKSKKKDYILVKKQQMKPQGRSKQKLEEVGSPVCNKCPKKMLCWIKNYDRTVHSFNMIPKEIMAPTVNNPSEILNFCDNAEKIVSEYRKDVINSEKSFILDYSKTGICKIGEKVCGDTGNVFTTSDNRCVITICDGMGSGHDAAKESQEISFLIENMLKKGFDKNDALLFVNQTLLMNGKGSIAGLDMLFIDLLNGSGRIIKANAAPTYVYRHGNIYEIGKASVPLGALDSPDCFEQNCIFLKDDIIIMVSDGFECDKQVLKECCKNMKDCLGAANAIAEKSNKPNDDVTVIVAKIA